MTHATHLPLVLSSTSSYRQELLQRLGLSFDTASPKTDEQRLPDEPAEALVRRLAAAKARSVARAHPEALIIGSDQVAVLDQDILGKPGNRERAVAQLRAASGRTVRFLTGLCLYNSALGREQVEVVPYSVTFRALDDKRIERYVDREQPMNCAGSFKSEGMGIALFERMEGSDPTALIGLPLITLVTMLASEGVTLP